MTKKTNLQLAAVAALVLALPVAAFGATYAYVDQTGEVKTVESGDPMTAMLTAPNIDEHSGVMLLDSTADYEVVGDEVQSVK